MSKKQENEIPKVEWKEVNDNKSLYETLKDEQAKLEEKMEQIATPSSTIRQWLYGGKTSSNQNNPSFSAQRLSSRK